MTGKTRHECTKLLEGNEAQWAFRKVILHYFHLYMCMECTRHEPWPEECWLQGDAMFMLGILFLIVLTSSTGCIAKKLKLQKKKKKKSQSYWLLLLK